MTATASDLRTVITAVRADGKNRMARCPAHEDARASLSVGVLDDGRIVLHCQAGCAFAAILAAAGLDARDLAPTTARDVRITRYEIRDEDGQLVAIHERRDDLVGKKFIWRQPDGTAGLRGRRVATLPLYGVERLRDWPGNRPVVLVEGEKAADALIRRDVAALATITGASTCPHDEVLRVLLGRPIILWPDHDVPGRAHMDRISRRLVALGHVNVRIVRWPQAPQGGDAADFTGDVSALLATAVLVSPTTTDPASTPDVVLDDDLPLNDDATPAAFADLLGRVEKFVRTFVVLTDDQATAIVLWVAHTHTLAAGDCTPYLQITSATAESGKTRLLETLALIVWRPWLTQRTSPAALIRKVDAERPTLLLDESDAAFNGNEEYGETLRGLLNSGYARSGTVTLCVGQGAALSFKDFHTFCAKAIAGIGRLPDTVQSRSLRIELRRRLKDEPVGRFRVRDVKPDGDAIARALAQWAPTAIAALRQAHPVQPAGLRDRAEDVCEPLLAIADLAGQTWPDRARRAAVALTGASQDSDIKIELLRDIQATFDARQATFLKSDVLAAALADLEGHAWASWGKSQKPMTMHALARQLKPFGIASHHTNTERGYRLAAFDDAFARYLAFKVSPRHSTNETRPESPISKCHSDPTGDTLKSEVSSIDPGLGDEVTLRNREKAGTDEQPAQRDDKTGTGTEADDDYCDGV